MRYDVKMSSEGGMDMETIKRGMWMNDLRGPNPFGVVSLKARAIPEGSLKEFFW
jgi:hypothetical protein